MKCSPIQFVLLSSVLAAISADAQEQSCPDRSAAIPAAIFDSDVNKRRISLLSPTWSSDEQLRFTWFSAYVGQNGNLDNICCFSSSRTITNVQAERLLEDLRKIRFEPASLDGKHMNVYANFTIIGVKTDAGFESRLFMSQLQSKDKHGINYSAPQRVNRNGRPPSTRSRSEFTVDVSKEGWPSNPSATQWVKGSNKMKQRFLDYMLNQCFVPGKVNGEAIAIPYFETFLN
jgi:hypothetical protein